MGARGGTTVEHGWLGWGGIRIQDGGRSEYVEVGLQSVLNGYNLTIMLTYLAVIYTSI